MDDMTVTYIIIAFGVGVIVGLIMTAILAGSKSNLTREETWCLNKLVDRAMNISRGFTITLYSEGKLIDQVTVPNRFWRR